MTMWFVREAVDADRPSLVDMMRALQAYEATIEPNRSDPDRMAEPHFRQIERWSGQSGGGVLVAAAPSADPIGFAVWGVEESFGCFVAPENQRYALISDLFVDESLRGEGVGRALIEAVEAQAAEAGLRRIEIGALAANARARAAYAACGYAEDSVTLFKPLRPRRA